MFTTHPMSVLLSLRATARPALSLVEGSAAIPSFQIAQPALSAAEGATSLPRNDTRFIHLTNSSRKKIFDSGTHFLAPF